MAKVQVHPGVLAGLGLALAASLLLAAYLLGLEAGRQAGSPGPVPGAPSAAAPPSPSPLPPAPGTGSSAAAAAPPLEILAPPGPADPGDPQRPAVQAYFQALDRIAPGQLAGDPQALAQEMVAGLGRGDASGFDRMIAQAEEARGKLAALQPPAPCLAFHQESLALLDENLALLKGVKRALDGREGEGSLGPLLARAQALQARSDALERADKALRARYGTGR
jgi:hypothetical protein